MPGDPPGKIGRSAFSGDAFWMFARLTAEMNSSQADPDRRASILEYDNLGAVNMKRLILAVVALLMLTSISSAQMGRRNRGYQQPRGGIFSRLIEMERAKNAWIRENIFRR